MVGLERSIRSDTIPNALLRVVVGDDGGTGAEFTERHIFRMLYLGWWLGTMVGLERSIRSDIHSEYST